jgi:hypothetical protein
VNHSSAAWSRAYAIQARADLAARDVLISEQALPTCQQLHFLQMACEKVAKAHLCWGGADPTTLQRSHVVVAKTIPMIARQLLARGVVRGGRSHEKMMKAIYRLAQEVDFLAPSADDGRRRPDNCEYPWEDDQGDLQIPAEYPFSELGRLHLHEAGRSYVKVIQAAADELAGGLYAAK